MWLLIHAGIKVKHVSKRGPRWQCVLPCILLYLHAFIPCLNKSCLILSRSEPLSIVSYRHGRKWPMENQYHIDDSLVIWASHRFGKWLLWLMALSPCISWIYYIDTYISKRQCFDICHDYPNYDLRDHTTRFEMAYRNSYRYYRFLIWLHCTSVFVYVLRPHLSCNTGRNLNLLCTKTSLSSTKR